ANVTLTQGLTNNGSIVLFSTFPFGNPDRATLTVTGGAFLYQSGATLQTEKGAVVGTGGVCLVNAPLMHQSTITLDQETSFSGTVTNGGTINVRGDDLTVNSTAPLTNNGTIGIDSLHSLFVQGGDFANSATVTVGSFGTFLVTGNYTQRSGVTR